VPSPAKLCPVISRGACGRYRDLIRGLSGQQIADCHSRAAVPIEYNDITGFDFFLHRVAAGIQRTTSHANRPAKFACADQNIHRALPGRMFQLSTNRPEFSLIMWTGTRIAPCCMTGILAPPQASRSSRSRPTAQGWPKVQTCLLLTRQFAATPLDWTRSQTSLHWKHQPLPRRVFLSYGVSCATGTTELQAGSWQRSNVCVLLVDGFE
jgi:hypothetical protein